MYAVINTGGKQYRVSKGDTIQIEKLDKDEGETILFPAPVLVPYFFFYAGTSSSDTS